MKTKIIGPYGSKGSRDRYAAVLRNRFPGMPIKLYTYASSYWIEAFNFAEQRNAGLGIMTLEKWIQYHSSKGSDVTQLTSPQRIERYWHIYVHSHGGSMPDDPRAPKMLSSWPPNYGYLPPLTWMPSPNYSFRNAPITGVIWHETEGGYEGSVTWLCNPSAKASCHLIIDADGKRAAQLVPYSLAAWHAKSANPHTIGVESTGYVATANSERQLLNMARIGAWLSHRFNIPVRQADKYGKGGHTTHSRLAGNDHTDPDYNGRLAGDGFDKFLDMIHTQYMSGNFPKTYGRY